MLVNQAREKLDSWFVRNLPTLKSFMRIIFGIIWGIDGFLKFQPGLVQAFPSMVADATSGQPSWLDGWFSFWVSATSSNPALFVYTVGLLELALSFSLIVGFMRKLAYGGGFLLSLLIWSVPEGFGGPYGQGSTDIGTGIVYAFVFLLLAIINATYGPSKYSLDYFVERRLKWWATLSEIRSS